MRARINSKPELQASSSMYGARTVLQTSNKSRSDIAKEKLNALFQQS